MNRCGWVNQNPLMIKYHDTEWGVPVHDDRKLFEFLILESAQAGLSWETVLNKRENYRIAFDGFDVERVAHYGEEEVTRLLNNPGIIRNRLKIRAAINNAQKFLEIRSEFGTFDRYIWRFISGNPKRHAYKTLKDIPPTTQESDLLSKDLVRRGFKFVGSTIIYAHMQAIGMVNDHMIECFRYKEV